MKTIDERAQEYAHQYRRDAHDLKGERADAAFAAYCQGAEDEHKELTRWHDPKEVISEPNHIVLTKWKYKDGSGEIISVGGFNGEEWDAHAIINPELFDIIGWREIHE